MTSITSADRVPNNDSFLEGELARRYRDAAPATLALLAERCGGARAELAAAQTHLHALTDVPTLRRDGASHPSCFGACVQIGIPRSLTKSVAALGPTFGAHGFKTWRVLPCPSSL